MIDEIKRKNESLSKGKEELYQRYLSLASKQNDLQAKYVFDLRVYLRDYD
jgi:FtsZ-binding cell division protein ZapB